MNDQKASLIPFQIGVFSPESWVFDSLQALDCFYCAFESLDHLQRAWEKKQILLRMVFSFPTLSLSSWDQTWDWDLPLSYVDLRKRLLSFQDKVYYQWGPYGLCDSLFYSSKEGETIELREKEAKLLKHLMINGPSNRASLLDSIWGYDASLCTRTLESHLSSLRHKLQGLRESLEIICQEGLYKLTYEKKSPHYQ